MNTKTLSELEFNEIINESYAQTQTGEDLLNKYKAYLMSNSCSYGLVNSFVKEAQLCKYDNGVYKVLENVVNYISENKTLWALATACENINYNTNSKNYLNRSALKVVEPLLNLTEDEVVKQIQTGALRNAMHCEAFKNIASQIYKSQPLVEVNENYVVAHPVSIVENVGDGHCFEVVGKLYKLDDEGHVTEAKWTDVSNTFKTITDILESNNCTVTGDTIEITAGKAKYAISEANKVTKYGKEGTLELSVEQLRENNNLMVMTANPRFKNQFASILEGVALIAENYDRIVNLDNVSIFSTKNDRFMVIESNDNLYATLLASNHSQKWTINENAINAVDFIRSKTNVNISDTHADNINAAIQTIDENSKNNFNELQRQTNIQSIKERIEVLTEKFKNDPVKLAVITKLAQDVAEL